MAAALVLWPTDHGPRPLPIETVEISRGSDPRRPHEDEDKQRETILKMPTARVITAVSTTGQVGHTSGNQEYETADEIKAALYKAVEGKCVCKYFHLE